MNVIGDPKLIAAAFIKARGEMEATVTKDAKGNFGKYVTLAAIVEATTSILAKNGLAVMQEVGSDEAGVTVDTWLVHESGAMMQFKPLTMPCDRKPQSVGSAITYGRRYALAAMCGLAPDDDDGQVAQDSTGNRQAAKAPNPRGAANHRNDVDFGKEDAPRETSEIWTSFNNLGTELYADQWGKVRQRNTERVSGGKATDSAELTAVQLQQLIDGMMRVKASRV